MARLSRLAPLAFLVALFALSAGVFGITSARADTSPPGCSANNISLDITRSLAPGETGPANASVVAQGQEVLYTVTVSNQNGTGCDVINADISLTLPALDGTATGTVVVLDTGASFPADGSGNTTYGPVSYFVNVNPGVTTIVARAELNSLDGLLDTPEGSPGDAVNIAKTVSSTVAIPSIDIEKATNGEDADTPTGPFIPAGNPVSWTYLVTNTGNVTLNNVTVTDDQGVAVTCPSTTLFPGASMVCTADGSAVAGQYANLGTVVGTDITGQEVTDEDPSHYFGTSPSIDIEKATNGEDADSPTGPLVPVGDPVAWTYVVTNTGNVPLSNVTVVDDQGVAVTCPQDTLAVGESMVCTADGIATEGQYANLGTTEGTAPDGTVVTDEDPSHYFGSNPSIDIEKATNGEDADSPTGPLIPVGDPVLWTYVVTNTGNVSLSNVTVVDDQGVVVVCPLDTLAVGESMVCTADGIATEGQYANLGTATGTPPVGGDVSDEDPSHYFGSNPSIDIEKATNGEDADAPTGPAIPVGGAVLWTYVVTNTGNVPLSSVSVVDDQGVAVTCPQDTLAVGESMVCTADGTATEGQYANLGTATGTPPVGGDVSDEDPSHYIGFIPPAPAIDIEKATNGEDADVPTGPSIPVGDPVLWAYVVTNTGNVPLSGVTVIDDQGVVVTCPQDTLAPGESMVCTADGIAVEGQYANVGTTTGTDADGTTVTDSDPSHYIGFIPPAPSIDIEKATNGEDADVPTGPSIPAGDPVHWTYVVTNTGNVPLSGVTVIDDQGVVVTCPKDTLAPGESMVCTADGIAVEGQYANVGTTTGTDPDGTTVTDSDPSHYFGTGGGEGCTPGYWKQPHHLFAWTGYLPSDSYSDVFGVSPAFGDKTLLEVLSQGGGGEIALGRHAVAALLNAASSDVDYLYSEAQVIAIVQDAYATGDFAGAKGLLEYQNELGCEIPKEPKDDNKGSKSKGEAKGKGKHKQ